MSRALNRRTLKVVMPGLVGGGLCGAALGFDLVPKAVGIAFAVALGLYVGFVVWRTRKRFSGHP